MERRRTMQCAMRRRASDGRSGRGPSKDDSDDASEWSSSCMEVDMVFGESASSDRMGCSSIIVALFLLSGRSGWCAAWGKCRGSYRLLGDPYRFSDAAMRAHDALFAHL